MRHSLISVVLLALMAIPVFAQGSGPAQNREVHGRDAIKPNASVNDPSAVLDRLFGRLVQTDDERTAKTIEQAIWRLWEISGSPTADALMKQSAKAMDGKDFRAAIRMLDVVVELEPEFSEAWNRRATAYFLLRDFDRSLADIKKTLELEPRHFGALSGRGQILRERGDEAGALRAFRRTIRIHPHLRGPKEAVKELELKLEKEI